MDRSGEVVEMGVEEGVGDGVEDGDNNVAVEEDGKGHGGGGG